MAIDLGKQQELNPDPKVIKQINFTENPGRAENPTFFIVEEAKETVLDFS